MENEVRKRDEIISQLQKRIQELERLRVFTHSPTSSQTELQEIKTVIGSDDASINRAPSKNGSSGSDDISAGEEGFMVMLFTVDTLK